MSPNCNDLITFSLSLNSFLHRGFSPIARVFGTELPRDVRDHCTSSTAKTPVLIDLVVDKPNEYGAIFLKSNGCKDLIFSHPINFLLSFLSVNALFFFDQK